MPSFATLVKEEITKLEYDQVKATTLLAALIKVSGKWNHETITYSTENGSIARLIYTEIKKKYKVIPKVSIRKSFTFTKKTIYTVTVLTQIEIILKDLGIINSEGRLNLLPPDYLYNEEDLKRVFLCGLFLGVGSVNDPKLSRYHLEFTTKDKVFAGFIATLLNEFNLNSKITTRNNNYLVYVKEAEKIGDFLRVINCYNAVMYFEDIRIYRDHKNMTNRLNNCEQANVDKIIATGFTQIKHIETIKANDAFSLLDEKIIEVANYRLKYPEASMQELSEIISLETGHVITKSGLNHRFRKIKELALAIENKR